MEITKTKIYEQQLLRSHVEHIRKTRDAKMLKESKTMAVQKLTKEIAQIPVATKKVTDSIFSAVQILNESKGSATSIPAVILALFPAATNFGDAAKEIRENDAKVLVNLVAYSGAKGFEIFKPSFIQTAENNKYGIETILEMQDLLFEALTKIRIALADGLQIEDASVALEITPDILAIVQQWSALTTELADLTADEFSVVFGHVGYNIYELLTLKA